VAALCPQAATLARNKLSGDLSALRVAHLQKLHKLFLDGNQFSGLTATCAVFFLPAA
jgi:hypothetical protein